MFGSIKVITYIILQTTNIYSSIANSIYYTQ